MCHCQNSTPAYTHTALHHWNILSMANSPHSMTHSSAADSTSKRLKLSNEEAKFNIDIISCLPDSVLSHILSFLPTKHAVTTSVLSTRWRYLWTLVHSLNFDDAVVLNNVGYISFVLFVYRVLVLRNASCIKKLRLNCGRNCDSLHYNAWVCAAITRKAEELDLSMSIEQPIELPRNLFTCNTLKVLKLSRGIVLDVPSSVHLPTLKILRLIFVKYLNDDSIRNLLSGCPVLEDLYIMGSRSNDVLIYNISAPALKNLRIEWFCSHPEPTLCKLDINAPALAYLNLTDYAEAFSIENLPSLAEAKVDVRRVCRHDEYSGNCAFELLRGLYNVTFLSLSQNTMETFKLASICDLPLFHNLTQLEIAGDWHLLPDFLESSHNLQVLSLDMYGSHRDGHVCWRQPPKVPKCLSFHLTTIDIKQSKGLKDEVKLVRYLLKNAEVLKMMRIRSSVHLNSIGKLCLLKKFSVIARVSKTCQLEFS